jgi:hypothetical protein
MAREYCALCGGVRNMVVTVGKQTRTGPDGKKQKVLVKVYHCEACARFIRSEESVQEG